MDPAPEGILTPGDHMSYNRKALQSLLRATQATQFRLRRYLRASRHSNIRSALEQQLRECDAIEQEIHTVASQRGWELVEQDPAICLLITALTGLKLRHRDRDARIAGLTIRDSANNMILVFTHMHRLSQPDARLKILFQKLLDCETACIRRMKVFL